MTKDERRKKSDDIFGDIIVEDIFEKTKWYEDIIVQDIIPETFSLSPLFRTTISMHGLKTKDTGRQKYRLCHESNSQTQTTKEPKTNERAIKLSNDSELGVGN